MRRRSGRPSTGPPTRTSTTRSCSRSFASTTTQRIVKSKSMLTEECRLNPFLGGQRHRSRRYRSGRTDRPAAGRTAQPHRVAGDSYQEGRGRRDVSRASGHRAGASDPKYLTEAARGHCGASFWPARSGITGVNFADRRNGRLRRLHQRGQRRPGRLAAARSHRLHGDRKADPAVRRTWPCSRGCWLARPPASRSPATRRISTDRETRRRAAHRAGRQRPQPAARERRVSRLAALHSLRRLHEHLPGLSPQRRAQLSRDRPGPDRLGPCRRRGMPRATRACPTRAACAVRAPTSVPSRFRCTISLLAWRKELVGRGLLPLSKRLSMKAASWLFCHPRTVCTGRPPGPNALRWAAALVDAQPLEQVDGRA